MNNYSLFTSTSGKNCYISFIQKKSKSLLQEVITVKIHKQIPSWITNHNLLLAECEVRTASYGPSFFLPFMAQARSARAMKTKKEKARVHNLPYGLSKTRLIRCLLYGFVDYSGFEKVIESWRSVRLLTDLELTNHSTQNQSAI